MVFNFGKFSPKNYLPGLFHKQQTFERNGMSKYTDSKSSIANRMKYLREKKRAKNAIGRSQGFTRSERSTVRLSKMAADVAQRRNRAKRTRRAGSKNRLGKSGEESRKKPMAILRKLWHLKKIAKRRNKHFKERQKSKRSKRAIGRTIRSTARSRSSSKSKKSRNTKKSRSKSRSGTRQRKRPARRQGQSSCGCGDKKIRRFRRYVTGEKERQRSQVYPVVSFSAERDNALGQKNKSTRRGLDGQDQVKDDPLNFRKLHRKYVKKLHGAPAQIMDGSKKKRRNKGSLQSIEKKTSNRAASTRMRQGRLASTKGRARPTKLRLRRR